MGNRSGISEPITHYPLPGSQIYIFPQLSERADFNSPVFVSIGYDSGSAVMSGRCSQTFDRSQQYHSDNFSIFIKTLIKGFVYKKIFINIYSRNRYGCYN
jgi:hypothetical protein